MKISIRMMIKTVYVLCCAGLLLSAGNVMAGSVLSPADQQLIDEKMSQMIMETIRENQNQQPFKAQMKAKIMSERKPKNYMKKAVMPIMMKKTKAATKQATMLERKQQMR